MEPHLVIEAGMNILNLIEKHELKELSEKSNLQAIWMTVANFALITLGFALPMHWHHWLA